MKINTLILVTLVVGLSALALLVPAHAASGPRCYVNDDATGANNGNSWTDAYTSLQSALADSNCTEIWVAAGVYYPDNTLYADNERSATFTLKNDVAIYGGFAGTETALSERNWRGNLTILSGDIDQNDINADSNYIAETTTDIQGSNAYHVVTGGGTNSSAVLDGFVITAGQADDANWPNERGGGMYNQSSSPTLRNLIFSGNFAVFYGGGMTNYNSSSPTLTNVTFSGNSATNGSGGGMFNANLSNPTLTNVAFSGNSASSGGGMRNENSSNPTLINVTFSGNSASSGGGMYNYSSNPTLINVTFSGNSATNQGGGMHNFGSNPTLINVIIWGSTSGEGIASIANSSRSNPRITHSNIEGCGYTGYWFSDCGWDDNGNIQGDPLFVDADGADNTVGTPDDNLRLGFGSPAIDKGINIDNYTGNGCPATDLDNLPRPTDGDANGTATCDMGAYEAGTMICSVGFGFYQFPHQSNVIIEVSFEGNLACLYVDEMGLDHPNATAGIKTGRYWLIRALQSDKTTPATFYIVHLTLPTTFTPDDSDKVCRYTGSGTVWDCAMSSYTSNAITRYGITELSDWAVEDNNVDNTAPIVSSITRADPNPTGAASVQFIVTFSEGVTGVDAGDFSLTTTGSIAGAGVTGVSGAGSVYNVTVSTGTGSGTLRLDIPGTATIADPAGNGLSNLPYTSGQVYEVDKAAPMVSMTSTAPNPTNASPIPVVVTFSEAVTGFTAADIAVSNSTVQNFAGSGAVYTFDLIPAADGLVTATIAAGVAFDAAGNGNTAAAPFSRTYDTTAPGVLSITRADPNPTNAASVRFTVTFSEAVTGVDGSDFSLATTGSIAGASVTGVSGSGSVYTVTVSTGTGSGTLRLDLKASGTGIQDLAGNPITGGFTSGEEYTVDKTAPTVVSITRADPNPTNAASVQFIVTFSEGVTGVDAGDFSLTTTGSIAGAGVTGVSGSGSVYTVTVSTGTGSGTLRLDIPGTATIADPAGNGLSNLPYTSGQVYEVDKAAPMVSMTSTAPNPTNASPIPVVVTFSEAVTGFTAADIAVSNSTVQNFAGSGAVYTFDLIPAADGLVTATIAAGVAFDAAGNGNTAAAPFSRTYDTTAPGVLSITRADPNPTNAASVRFTVTFSEAVTGVDGSDFSLATTGSIAGASVTGVSGSGSVYTVTVSTGTGSGTLRLDIPGTATVTDPAGNGLSGLPYTGGQAYDVDKTAPTASSTLFLPVVLR
ncbi:MULTISPECIES: beta strand repeat-containing protein [Caldilinea]|uniref:Bacterial Ig-like domain-containing protein n=1 Tax=Caldilinea aerophila (strain DSM 14535 / JCM 11387 / NBRC 104270 / STL-6-O1) TaxID=926550 RepID=I0I401_CALAS|nr:MULTISPECIES: Ig-like domain-containing protein [Caldilinea]BAL99988.1 hypothetical protein CLDAP_19490 [Caldilinea aerophila DSM 14535 = NBRC 104270]GIV73343.1 MAG: hypothetical protein KatS3mg049_1899 [Caldilinea sp.]